MQQVGEWILHELGNGSWWVGVPAAIVIVVLKARRLLEAFDWHRLRRPRELESAVKSEVLDDTSKRILADLACAAVFNKACGRRIEPATKALIVTLNEVDSIKLTISKLVAASAFLHRDADGFPTIRISRGDRIEHAYDSLIGILSLLGISIVPWLLWLLILGRTELTDLLGVGIWCLMCVGGFVFAVAQARPYFTARGIEVHVASAAKALRSRTAQSQQSQRADSLPRNSARRTRSPA